METIAILGGTGSLGYGLAMQLAKAGYSIVIGSRDVDRAEDTTYRVSEALPRGDFRGCTNANAAASADRLIINAVPFANQRAILTGISQSVHENQIILNTTVPLDSAVGGRPTHLIGVWSGSAAQQARAIIPSYVGVVSGLHTLSATVLDDSDCQLDQDTLICGDNVEHKAIVSEILSRLNGLRVIDAGSLEMSRMVEGITPLLIGINIRNKTHAGIQIVGIK